LRRSMLFVILAALIAAASSARGVAPFYPLSEIRPGLKGVAYTVISGTDVRSFTVEILGLAQISAQNRQLILVKVSGALLREGKGIAAGMSGSPVYINDRLVGAISYGFERADPQYGLVTPIEYMMGLWERYPESGGLALAPSPILPPGCTAAVPVSTPLLISGRRVPAELKKAVGGLGLTLVVAGGSGTGTLETPAIQPGSAIAAVYAYGDYNAAAIGTVTWIDGRRFLAFGHPIANLGNVEYMAAGAYIYQIIPSADMPFKIGTPLNRIGRFVQDRGAGAGGILGEQADTVLVKATVLDKSTGKRANYETAVIREPSLLKAMSIAALLDAIDRTLDQYSAGSARVVLRIEGEGLDKPLVRHNMFFSYKDVATASLSDVGEAVDLITGNSYQQVRIKSIAVDVTISQALDMAAIESVRADRTTVRPGEQVLVDVELHPYRAEKTKASFIMTIPGNTPRGKMVITVRGGFQGNRNEDEEQLDLHLWLRGHPPTSLSEEVAALVERPRNNDLILEYIPFASDPAENDPDLEPVLQIQGCGFVVQGEHQLILEIMEPAENN